MPFEKGDENINRRGRQASDKPRTKRSRKQLELRKALNKIRPHVADAIARAAELMNSKNGVSDATQLKAAMFLIQEYQKLVVAVEAEEQEEDNTDIGATPVVQPFSLKQVV